MFSLVKSILIVENIFLKNENGCGKKLIIAFIHPIIFF